MSETSSEIAPVNPPPVTFPIDERRPSVGNARKIGDVSKGIYREAKREPSSSASPTVIPSASSSSKEEEEVNHTFRVQNPTMDPTHPPVPSLDSLRREEEEETKKDTDFYPSSSSSSSLREQEEKDKESSPELLAPKPEDVARFVDEWEHAAGATDRLVKGNTFGLTDGNLFKKFFIEYTNTENPQLQRLLNWEIGRLPVPQTMCTSPRFTSSLWLHTKVLTGFNFLTAVEITTLYFWIRLYLTKKFKATCDNAFKNRPYLRNTNFMDNKVFGPDIVNRYMKQAFQTFEDQMNEHYNLIAKSYGAVSELGKLQQKQVALQNLIMEHGGKDPKWELPKDDATSFSSNMYNADLAVKYNFNNIIMVWEYFFWKMINLISCIEYFEYCSLVLHEDGRELLRKLNPEKKDEEFNAFYAEEKIKSQMSLDTKQKFLDPNLFTSNIDSILCENVSVKLERFLSKGIRFATHGELESHKDVTKAAQNAHAEALKDIRDHWEDYAKMFDLEGKPSEDDTNLVPALSETFENVKGIDVRGAKFDDPLSSLGPTSS